ncbi:MAG: hypothetical protein ACYC7D_12710 [Nitrososphaerales archaeon]
MANSKQSNGMRQLELELESREHNLRVIQETIERDPKSGMKLVEVRDLLARRVSNLRQQIVNSNPKIEFAG